MILKKNSTNLWTIGYDCGNNLDNCKFVPIVDELKEITNINRCYTIFDSKISELFTTNLLKADIEEKFNKKLIKLDKEDRFYEIKLQTIKTEWLHDLEAAEKFEQKNKKKIDWKNQALTNQKVKSLIDFDEEYSSSTRSIAIEKSSKSKFDYKIFEWRNVYV